MVLPFMSLYLQNAKGFPLLEIGWIMSALGFGSITGSYIGGKLVDRYGQYYVQIGSLVLSALIFCGFPLLEGIVQITFGLFLLNTATDAFRPANSSAMAVYSSEEQRTRSVSLNRLAINLGFAIGPASAGIITGMYGYEMLFYLDGITCLIAAILLLAFLTRKEEEKTTSKERKTASKEILYKDKQFHFFLFLVFLGSFTFLQYFSTVPVFWDKELGLSTTQIGWWLAFNGGLIFILEMPLVYILEKKRDKQLLIIKYGVLLIACSYLAFLLPISTFLMVLLFVLFITLGEILALPFQTNYALHRADPKIRGNYMGWYGMMWSISMMIGPPLGFAIADRFGFYWLMGILSVITLLVSLGFGILSKKEKKMISIIDFK